MTADSDLVLRPSRTRWVLVVAASLALVAGGWLVRDESRAVAVAVMVAFGVAAVVGLVSMLPGAGDLRIHDEGFEVRTLFRGHEHAWADIDHVTTYTPGRRATVGFVRSPHVGLSPGEQPDSEVADDLPRVDVALDSTYGMGAEDLAALLDRRLEEYRRLHPDRDTGPAAT